MGAYSGTYDQTFLTNDAAGNAFFERHAFFGFANESSAHGAAGITVAEVFTVPGGLSGEIVDFQIGVVLPAVSASGFVSGTTTAQLRINSVAALSTQPAIALAGSAGQAYRVATQFTSGIASSLVTSGVVNAASAAINAGDQISVDMTANSAGSAAAGAAGKGLYGVITYRYKAR
jgi:hypothetical protein